MTEHAPARCRNHGNASAYWSCTRCKLSLCTDCKPFAEQLPIEIACPLCGQAMTEIDSRTRQASWLTRVLGGDALTVGLVALIATLTAVAPWPMPGLLIAIPAALFLLAAMVSCARSAGEAWDDSPTWRRFARLDHLEFVLQKLGFALPFLAAWLLALGMQSTILMVLTMAAASALLPATLMATMVAGNAWEGLLPDRCLSIIRTLGSRYTALIVATGAPLALAWIGALALGNVVSTTLLTALLVVPGAFYALAWSRVIGTVLYRNRRLLEYPAGVPAIDRPKRPAADLYEPALMSADADTLISEGMESKARKLLARALTRYPDEPALNDRFEQLLKQGKDDKAFKSYIERRMQRLIKAGRTAEATRLWQRNSRRLDNWLPKVAATRFRIALELEERGDYPMAFRLLVSLPLKARGIGQPGAAWARAAAILEEDLGDRKRAEQLRQVIAEKSASGGQARSLSEKRCTDAARAERERRLSGGAGRERAGRTAS